MNTRKLIAGAILALTILFPFRYAFLDQPDHGPKSLMSFLLVLIGGALFAVFSSSKSADDSKMNAEKKFDHSHKKAA
jgi:hypothetical protein